MRAARWRAVAGGQGGVGRGPLGGVVGWAGGAEPGGEQARLAFLKLMLTGANFLVLDEPTNHLDIPAKEAVEEALMAFPGTFIVVSHDRYFLDKVSNYTVELENGKLTEYGGNYSYYREKKEELLKEAEELLAEEASRKDKKAVPEKEKKEVPVREKSSSAKSKYAGLSEDKRADLLLRAEAEIAMAEAELKMLEHEMNDPAVQSDPERSARIAEEYAEKEKEIERRYEDWGELSGEA